MRIGRRPGPGIIPYGDAAMPDVGLTAGEAARWLAALLGEKKAACLVSSLVIRVNLLAQLGNGLRTTDPFLHQAL